MGTSPSRRRRRWMISTRFLSLRFAARGRRRLKSKCAPQSNRISFGAGRKRRSDGAAFARHQCRDPFLTGDHPKHSPRSRKLFARAAAGEVTLVLTDLALAETAWVLQSFYSLARRGD